MIEVILDRTNAFFCALVALLFAYAVYLTIAVALSKPDGNRRKLAVRDLCITASLMFLTGVIFSSGRILRFSEAQTLMSNIEYGSLMSYLSDAILPLFLASVLSAIILMVSLTLSLLLKPKHTS